MKCYSPLRVGRGRVNLKSGKQSITFDMKEYIGQRLELPCGKCPACRADQSMMWSVRCYQEASLHKQNSFITLTYDEANVPPELQKEDLQKFFKRLRHHYGKFRYFACGEYGEQTRRPHYHALIFGHDFLAGAESLDEKHFINPVLTEIWGQGHTVVDPVNMATCCYVSGYTNKKNADPDTFTLMSRRPGIGHDWLDAFSDDLRRNGTVAIEGREYAIPKRYLAWKDADDPTYFDQVKADRQKYVRLTKIETVMQARARLLNQKARIKTKKEKI